MRRSYDQNSTEYAAVRRRDYDLMADVDEIHLDDPSREPLGKKRIYLRSSN